MKGKIVFFCLGVVISLFSILGCTEKKQTPDSPKLFTLLSETQTGIDFKNTINDTGDITIYDNDFIYVGAGVATGDINNDGLVDIFFSGNQAPSKLYLNQGDFKFKDVTKESGIFDKGWPTGVVMADVNGDSYLDIYLSITGFKQEKDKRNLLFINNGNLTFSEKAAEYGIADNGCSQIGNFFDFDNDGDLDLFVVNQPDDIKNTAHVSFYFDPGMLDTLNCNQLYENIGDKFINVTRRSGINYLNADGLCVSIADVNNDGFQDIYVNNDLLMPDFLFINNGDKTFREALDDHVNVVPFFSMGSTFSDFNNDGLMDIVSTEMMPPGHLRRKNSMPHPDIDFYTFLNHKWFNSDQHSRNMLQIQNPDGSFSEIGELANISRTDWSFATLGCDFNNDTYQDLFITNGAKRDVFDQTYLTLAFEEKELYEFKYHHDGKDLIKKMPIYLMPAYIYENNGDYTFTERINEWGLNQSTASQGAAYADLNNDGYPELIVSNTDSVSFIYRNNGPDILGYKYLKVKCSGENKNTYGLGAKVKIYLDNDIQYRQMQNALGWYSSSEPALFFGLGNDTLIDSLEVWWLGGKYQKLYGINANQTLTLYEKDAVFRETLKKELPKLFTATDTLITPAFIHQESDFTDYYRDKLIPKMLSREGPGVAVADVNNDGMEDFFVGGAAGQPGALYMQKRDGIFSEMKDQPWHNDREYEDMSPVFFDINNDGYNDLYVSSGSNEFMQGSRLLADRIYLNDHGSGFKRGNGIIPEMKYSKGIIRSADIDGDGDQDLFVAGRVKNQSYPSAPENYLLINEDGRLIDKTDGWNSELKNYGMVTDAKFVDMNNDGNEDLVLCGEWLPVSIFINTGDRYENRTDDYDLGRTNGWWNSLIVADFNSDGEQDIVAGNFGLNSILKCSEEEPIIIYYDDFDRNGIYEPVLCHYRDGILAPYADRDLFIRSLPTYQTKFLTYRSYGEASIHDIFTENELNNAEQFFAYRFQSTLFLNEEGKFNAIDLPIEAQVAPIYGMTAADFDADGLLDIFVCGNTYSSFYEEGPMTALRGLLLKGEGKGNFKVLKYHETGISLNMDSKAAGLIHLKSQGSYCLIISNNNDQLKLYKFNKPLEMDDEVRNNGNGYLFNYTPSTKPKS